LGQIQELVATMARQNASTAHVYCLRLKYLNDFSLSKYKTDMDNILPKLKQGTINVYEFLNAFVEYLQYNHNLSPHTLKQHITTSKNFIEYNDVDISPLKFKLKIKMKKAPRHKEQALSKEDIIKIINSCSGIRLRTYILLLAATGMRAEEALSIRIKEIDFDSRRIVLRSDSTKTKVERTVLLTEEVITQIKVWLDYKSRDRRICYMKNGKSVTEIRSFKRNQNDLVFGVRKGDPSPHSIYTKLCAEFAKTLDRIDMGAKEEFKENPNNHKRVVRRKITLHSFRRFVYSALSDLGYGDFSDYFIGHSGSTYYTKTDKQISEIFKKIEHHLTFLDYPTLERKGADVEAKVENLEQENQRLRHSDQLKEDALATLSDQVMKLMVEVQELKK
jgi:integrase